MKDRRDTDDRWGHMPAPGGGKVVWAEVALLTSCRDQSGIRRRIWK